MSEFRLFIPEIGDNIQLVEDWEFPLYFESRNHVLIQRIKPGSRYSYSNTNNSILVKMEVGTILKVDRIYIRKGKSEWSSVTFYVKYAPNDVNRENQTFVSSQWEMYRNRDIIISDNKEQARYGARFWAKLEHINDMLVKRVDDADIPARPKRKKSK